MQFPLDIHEFSLATPIETPTQSIVEYITYLGRVIHFSRELLAWVTEDRREQHHERTNMKRKVIQYKVGDIVMGQVTVQSNNKRCGTNTCLPI